MATASVIDGTTVSMTGGSTLPGNLPTLKVRESSSASGVPQGLPASSHLLEYIEVTPSQHLVGIDGLTMSVTVPSSSLATGAHYYAMLCFTDAGDNACQSWDGPFGPASVTPSGTNSTISALVPIPELPGNATHTVAIYAVPDGSLASPTPAPDTSFLTKENDPAGKIADLGIHLSVNGDTPTAWTPKGLAYGNAAIGQNGSDEPLDVSEMPVWQKDLPLIRGLGANAIRVYDVYSGAPQTPAHTSAFSIDQFLKAAYIGARSPQNVYVLLGSGMGAPGDNAKTTCAGTKYTPASNLSCYGTTTYNNWIHYYTWLARHYGGNPAVLGFTLGNEINTSNDETSPGFWNQLSNMTTAIRNAMKSKKYDGQKLVVFSAVNDMNTPGSGATIAMQQGETIMQKTLFKSNGGIGGFDVWGYDVYDGPEFGCNAGNCFFTDVQSYTSRPVTFLEFGAQSSYHPLPGATPTPAPPANDVAVPLPHVTGTSDAYPCTSTFPIGNSPTMRDVVTFYGCGQTNLDNYNVATGMHGASDVMSGGFVFELMDEFFKQGGGGCLYYHCGGPPNTEGQGYLTTENSYNPNLFYDDEAYLGLMSVDYGPPSFAPAAPGTGQDTRTPRETYCWFQYHWTGSYAAPCQPQVRFINGTVGASTASVSWSIDGLMQGAVAQLGISAYAKLPAAAPATHTLSYGSGSCPIPALLPASRTTVVLTGGSGVAYGCQVFDEPEVTNTAVFAVFHNAAAVYASTSGNTIYPYVSYALAASGGGNPLQYPTPLGQGVVFGGPAVLFGYPIPTAGYLNDSHYGSGTAFQVYNTPSQQTPFTSLATFLPSSADPADTKEYIPSRQGAMGTDGAYHSGMDANAALFVLDNPSGGISLVGTFTP